MSADSPSPSQAPGIDRQRLRDLLTGPVTSIALALLVVVVVGLTWVGPRFLSASNITIIGTFVAVPMLVAAFAGFALLAGVVDLSIGSMLGLSSAICATLMAMGWPLAAVIPATLAACLFFGSINAVAVVIFGADTIAATLGMLVALRGISYIITAPRRLDRRLRRRLLHLHQLHRRAAAAAVPHCARADRHRRDHRQQDADRAARAGGRRRRASRRLAPAFRSPASASRPCS